MRRIVGAAAACAVVGCTREPEPAKIAPAVAPVQTVEVKAETLPRVRFVEVTKDAGIDFTHCSGATGAKLLPETMGSGVAFLDYDGDGDFDLFFVNACPWPGESAKPGVSTTQKLYRNDGRGKFEDVTKAAGLDLTCFGMGVGVGDFDNDGDDDLYLTTVDGGRLLRNDGGKFLDVTAMMNAGAGGGWLTSAAFLDMDNDGDLDLFVGRYVNWSAEYDKKQSFNLSGTNERSYGPPTAFNGSFCTLLRNDGDRFVDVSAAAGIQIKTPDLKAPVAKSLGVAPYDIDGDGRVDIAVANDTVPNFLFHNLGGGKFDEIGIAAGMAFDQAGSARGAMGIDWADFKNDGTLGLVIGNFANEMTALYVTDEPETLQFSDLANIYGLGAPTQPPMKFGIFFFDYDLDGRLDVLSTNGHLENDIAKVQKSQTYEQAAQLFWNTGKPGRSLFAQVGPEVAGPDLFTPIVGRGSAYADIDGDGDLDVVLTSNGGRARLFRNDGGSRNHAVRLRLRGSKSNRDGIGARVTAKAGDRTQRRQLFLAKGYMSSVEPVLTIGLGAAEKVDELKIQWPSGKTTTLTDVKAGPLLVDEEKGPIPGTSK